MRGEGFAAHQPVLLATNEWYVGVGLSSKANKVFAWSHKPGANTNAARLLCAQQAHAGDADAITAVLMCPEDSMLQYYVRDLRGE